MSEGLTPQSPQKGDTPPDRDVLLHYIDKAQDAFTSNRTYANRVLVAQTVVALITIGIVIGAAVGTKFTIGSSDFTVEVWAVLLCGAMFVGLTPGFVVGRLLYNAALAAKMQKWYGELESTLEVDPEDTAIPWEIAPLVSEAGWASARVFKDLSAWRRRGRKRKPATPSERLGTAADFVGGPLTFVVLFAVLPVGAQVLAGVWWVQAVESTGWGRVIGVGVFFLVVLTIASVGGAALRLKARAEQAGAYPFSRQRSAGLEPVEASQQVADRE